MSSQVNKMSRRSFLQGTALVTAGSLLAACQAMPAPAGTTGASTSTTPGASVDWLHAEDISNMPPTTVRYWFYETPERTELGKKQVVDFHNKYPNITVDGRVAPPSVDNQMLLAYIKAGTNSHVHQSVCNEDTWYISHDLLLPLDGLPGFTDVWNRMMPNLNYTWGDGHVYSISWYSGPWVMYYNKKLVESAGLDAANPPKTYSEFLTWAAALTTGEQFFSALSSGEEWWRWEFTTYPFYIAASGSNQLHSQDGKTAVFNTPEMVAVYDLINTLFAKGYNPRETFEGNPFFSGKVAASLSGASMLTSVKHYAPADFEMVVGPVPKPDDSKVEGFHTYNFVRNFALMREQSKTGEEQDRINRAAWEFMQFLLSPDESAADFAAQGDFPCEKDWDTKSIYADTLASLGPVAKDVVSYQAGSYIYDMNTHLESESMGVLTKAYLATIFQKQTPAEAVQWAEGEVNKLLAAG